MINPLACSAAAKYLKDEWLKKPAMWTRGALDIIQLATGMVVRGNNQHSEGVFSYLKNRTNMKNHVSEPALYMIMRWKEHVESSKQLVVNLNEAKAKIERKKEKRTRRQRNRRILLMMPK